MRKTIAVGPCLLWLFLIFWLTALPTTTNADKPVVRAVMFWGKTCPHCHDVIDHVLPGLQERYGDQLAIRLVEVSEQAGYELWLKAMETHAVPPQMRGVPMLFIGDRVLVGSREIPDQLPGLIDQYLQAGGVDYLDLPGLLEQPLFTLESATPPTSTPTPSRDHLRPLPP